MIRKRFPTPPPPPNPRLQRRTIGRIGIGQLAHEIQLDPTFSVANYRMVTASCFFFTLIHHCFFCFMAFSHSMATLRAVPLEPSRIRQACHGRQAPVLLPFHVEGGVGHHDTQGLRAHPECAQERQGHDGDFLSGSPRGLAGCAGNLVLAFLTCVANQCCE